MMLPEDPNWRMTVLFLLSLALMGFTMKLIALFLPAKTQPDRSHVFWLLLSPSSMARLRPVVTVRRVFLRAALLLVAVVLSYWFYDLLVREFHLRGVFLSYCAAPVLLLVSETLVAMVTLLWLPSGQMLPVLHNRPPLAKSVADFWGNRWNLWFSDWIRYAVFRPLRKRPVLALVLAFAVSGLLHEWVVNVPLYYLTGRVLFGSMMVYFLLQAGGILLERRFLARHSLAKVLFVWLVVFVPSPLVINEGLLRTLHLWPDKDTVTMDIVNKPNTSENALTRAQGGIEFRDTAD